MYLLLIAVLHKKAQLVYQKAHLNKKKHFYLEFLLKTLFQKDFLSHFSFLVKIPSPGNDFVCSFLFLSNSEWPLPELINHYFTFNFNRYCCVNFLFES